MLSLFYYVSEYILRAFSLSLSLLLVVIIAQRRLTRFFSLSLSFKVLFLFRFSFVIDTKTRDSFKQQRSVAHRIWNLLELDACTVRLL